MHCYSLKCMNYGQRQAKAVGCSSGIFEAPCPCIEGQQRDKHSRPYRRLLRVKMSSWGLWEGNQERWSLRGKDEETSPCGRWGPQGLIGMGMAWPCGIRICPLSFQFG
ncbi:hypothetical protein OIU84_021547 [Salix udensis]|uniref:Uncharacterized protein n=1 Tax=Salix udensis TaxID=889485 RepID=A0AAD6KUU0_9ROSI|nr:hypothetical protein OIU84_021547 [Salix udensis]